MRDTSVTSTRPSPSRSRRIDLLIVCGFLLGLAAIRAGRVGEVDQFWEARAGIENLAGQPLARPDAWSWAPVDGLWFQNSPLWNTVLGIAYSAADFWGLFLLAAITLILLLLSVLRLATAMGARLLPGLLGMMPLLLADFPFLSPRATIVAQLLVLASILWAVWWAERAPRMSFGANFSVVLAVALGLSVFGLWLHLSFLAWSLLVALVWSAVWLLTPEISARTRWALVVAGSTGWLLGLISTPFGLPTAIWRSVEVQRACQGLVIEWSSPFHPQTPSHFIAISLIALVSAAGAAAWTITRLKRGKRDRLTRLLVALTIVSVPTAVAGLVTIRFLGVALPALAPVAAAAMTRLVDLVRRQLLAAQRPKGIHARLTEYSSGRFWRITLGITLVLLGPLGLVTAALSVVPAEKPLLDELPRDCQLFSDMRLAGISLLTRPDVQVWIDSRIDFYGREHTELTYNFYLPGRSPDLVPPGTTCVLLDATAFPVLASKLTKAPEWARVGTLGAATLWLPVN